MFDICIMGYSPPFLSQAKGSNPAGLFKPLLVLRIVLNLYVVHLRNDGYCLDLCSLS